MQEVGSVRESEERAPSQANLDGSASLSSKEHVFIGWLVSSRCTGVNGGLKVTDAQKGPRRGGK